MLNDMKTKDPLRQLYQDSEIEEIIYYCKENKMTRAPQPPPEPQPLAFSNSEYMCLEQIRPPIQKAIHINCNFFTNLFPPVFAHLNTSNEPLLKIKDTCVLNTSNELNVTSESFSSQANTSDSSSATMIIRTSPRLYQNDNFHPNRDYENDEHIKSNLRICEQNQRRRMSALSPIMTSSRADLRHIGNQCEIIMRTPIIEENPVEIAGSPFRTSAQQTPSCNPNLKSILLTQSCRSNNLYFTRLSAASATPSFPNLHATPQQAHKKVSFLMTNTELTNSSGSNDYENSSVVESMSICSDEDCFANCYSNETYGIEIAEDELDEFVESNKNRFDRMKTRRKSVQIVTTCSASSSASSTCISSSVSSASSSSSSTGSIFEVRRRVSAATMWMA